MKQERDHAKKLLKEALQRVRRLETQARELPVQNKVDLISLALQLFIVARIGFRAVSRVLDALAKPLGINKAPCPQTVINWVSRLSLVRIQSALAFKGLPLRQDPFCNGLIWMIDTSIALGTGKILAVLALDAHHHQFEPAAPGFHNVRCLAVVVADSWTGETIADVLRRLIAVMGRPAAYLKDGGSDLQKAIRVLAEQGLASPSIGDISHVIANLLKRRYQQHPMFEIFLAACGRVSAKLKQTILACLAPPKIQTKARFMNVHRLIIWAERLLKLSPAGAAVKGSILSKLRACFDRLPSCKSFIKSFLEDAVPLLECQKILKTQGLSHDTLAQCQPIIEKISSASVRRDFTDYLQSQLGTATTLGLEDVGLPISSDQIESLFGMAKLHGCCEIKDADRIAMRLPALCGPPPTREEAELVLGVSVVEQNELIGYIPSLIKQRREVLPNPDRLESLHMEHGKPHVELIPRTKNRGKNEKIIEISDNYPNRHGPEIKSSHG